MLHFSLIMINGIELLLIFSQIKRHLSFFLVGKAKGKRIIITEGCPTRGTGKFYRKANIVKQDFSFDINLIPVSSVSIGLSIDPVHISSIRKSNILRIR